MNVFKLRLIGATIIIMMINQANAASEFEPEKNRLFWKQGERINHIGQNQLKLNIHVFHNPNSKAQILISPGFTEASAKYREVARKLYDKGYTIFVLDHRGQGFSDGETKIKGLVHIKNFDHYVTDLLSVAKTVMSKDKPRYLLAHSMGGAISIGAMAKEPDLFKKAALSAPMLQINAAGLPEWLALTVCNIFELLGLEERFVPGSNTPKLPIPFKVTRATSSKKRFDEFMNFLIKKGYDVKGGGSISWVKQAIVFTKKIRQKKLHDQLKTQILLLEAGVDHYVKTTSYSAFCENTKCQHAIFPEAKHEIYFERDAIHKRWLKLVGDFFASGE